MVATAYQVDASIEEERERSAWPLLFFFSSRVLGDLAREAECLARRRQR